MGVNKIPTRWSGFYSGVRDKFCHWLSTDKGLLVQLGYQTVRLDYSQTATPYLITYIIIHHFTLLVKG